MSTATFHSDQKFLSATIISHDGSVEIRSTTSQSKEIVMNFGSIVQMENFARFLLCARKNLAKCPPLKSREESFTYHSKKNLITARIYYSGRIHIVSASGKYVCEFPNIGLMLSFRSFLLEACKALRLSFE